MGGTPANAQIWPDADVYIGSLTATAPADVDTEFGADWDLVGLLNGEEGFVHSRSEDVNDRFAWGGILVRTTRKNFKQTVKFTALEWNEVTRDLIYPNSTFGELIVPRPKSIRIAFETREDDHVRRLISKYRAEVAVDGDIVEKEDDLTSYGLLATIFPDADGVLFIEQDTLVVS